MLLNGTETGYNRPEVWRTIPPLTTDDSHVQGEEGGLRCISGDSSLRINIVWVGWGYIEDVMVET